ncbi:MAG: cobyric acid synthase [Magnetococcales bacterium]|uniref:Cobyric acid synthase n=1 Tax=Candidatus Magnetobacterium casense TaxID=1455061 RepID=A0ABS6RVE9_9BACT|nr:cobyric acid synthase [Candidatus Magnetobacterium casensis]MBF0607499.1 cobyric acid synthase [Nitrospirota bacterium]MBV6340609.1 cobyric acid synthase [Candidatus Magnetobacterium casensis]
MSKFLMIQGTGSGVGKSLLVAALCRIFKQRGIKVAPFKAQNMALNSYITIEGGEIGRAQALQGQAAGIEPSIYLNPILLKASGESGSQVIFLGKVHATMSAQEYYRFRDSAWPYVEIALERLSSQYDLIVIEGAGSPAEINLSDVEIVNMAVARHTNAPVLLVGDIDRGGVFASLYGTVALIPEDAHRIKGFIINKFRGDADILTSGIDMLSAKTGIPVLGVLPYAGNLRLPEEDGLAIDSYRHYRDTYSNRPIKVRVLRLRYISNFTDFDPFLYEPDVELSYTLGQQELLNSDLIIIPGSKNTVSDLLSLRANGLEAVLKEAARRGIPIAGICGGYQMLGKLLSDPHCVESHVREVEGLGLLDISTTFNRTKTTRRVRADLRKAPWLGRHVAHTAADHLCNLQGYEIHMGQSQGRIELFDVSPLDGTHHYADGSSNGNVWGTYLHGIFDNDAFRRALVNALRVRRSLPPLETAVNYHQVMLDSLDSLAGVVKTHLDMEAICKIADLNA